MEDNKFNAGDRVSIEATVLVTKEEDDDLGFVEIRVDGGHRVKVYAHRLTMVKKFEKPLQEPPVGASFPVGTDDFIYVRTAKEWLAIDPYGDRREDMKVVYLRGNFRTMLEKDGEWFRNAVEAYWKAREDEIDY